MSTFIIAEAGVNHNGSLELAKKLVDVAVLAGADAVKFQTFKAEKVVTLNCKKADYQVKNLGTSETQFEMLKKLELSEENHYELFKYCRERGIEFLSTPFDQESADFLEQLGIAVFKIPSGEITNKPLVRHIARKRKPIILSTGMAYLGEVEKSVRWIWEEWGCESPHPKLTLLHCVTDYPAKEEETNLRCIQTMKRAFDLPVGYSDHTMGFEIPVAAVALGATVIEKHFTLDRMLPGPDHKASLEPSDLNEMVKAIRRTERALGNGVKVPTISEKGNRVVARRGIVAARDIAAGEVLSPDNIAAKRPLEGISAEHYDMVIGCRVRRPMPQNSSIFWDDLER